MKKDYDLASDEMKWTAQISFLINGGYLSCNRRWQAAE